MDVQLFGKPIDRHAVFSAQQGKTVVKVSRRIGFIVMTFLAHSEQIVDGDIEKICGAHEHTYARKYAVVVHIRECRIRYSHFASDLLPRFSFDLRDKGSEILAEFDRNSHKLPLFVCI